MERHTVVCLGTHHGMVYFGILCGNVCMVWLDIYMYGIVWIIVWHGIVMYGVASCGMVRYTMVWYGLASCVAPTAGDDGGSTPAPPTAPNTPQEQTSSNSKEQTSHQNQTQTQTSKETSPEAKRNQANFYLTHEKRRNRKMRQHKTHAA